MQPSSDTSAKSATVSGPQFLGHPVGLYVLFLAQMWERFSYFGMLALLILYLNKYFKLPQEDASTIYKWYTSVIYFTPIVGAYLADRYLGNKLAVLLGASLMALGHFLMVFPSLTILYGSLVSLVVGFGLLTPPLTTQVGLLYAPHDPRRDSGYTIFYMGINVGGAISPFLCGWLSDNTRGGFHSGFALAGIGMVVALTTYLLGLRWIVEIDQGTSSSTSAEPAARSETAIEQTPSVQPWLASVAPRSLIGLGILLSLAAPVGALSGQISWDTAIFMIQAAIASFLFGWITGSVRAGLRDRVLAILLLIVFSTFYWVGAGQGGNAINLWAEQNTDRSTPPPIPFPEAAPEEQDAGVDADNEGPRFWERWTTLFQRIPKKDAEADKGWGEWWIGLWSPLPTTWFQSVNPLMILFLAPLFAWLWTWLGRRGINLSIPTKMGLGLLLMTLAFVPMWLAGGREAQETSVPFPAAALPAPLVANASGQVCLAKDGQAPEPYHAGRLFYDASSKRLRAVGVFPDLVRDRIVADTAPPDFVKKVKELQKDAASSEASGRPISVKLDRTPPGFDLRYAGFGKDTGSKQVHYQPTSRTLTTTIPLEEKEEQGLKVAAGDPTLRDALHKLTVEADAHRVSPWWLVAFFLLATLGELCLSPVGMSMVSQLAPARFATMLMGLWLLIFAFGNYLAGALGEKWGTWTPVNYFVVLLAVVGCATLLLFAIGPKIAAMMHEDR